MKFSESWLREIIKLPVDSDRLIEQFNLSGLEVDAVETAAPPFSGVVVAEIVAIAAHPEADRLRVCTVNCGDKETLQIVCGAANARKGLKAPLAIIGAELPGDLKIKKGKLRGVESFGMLCSEAELGLADKAEGLLELPADAPVGQDIRKYLNLDDRLIEIDLTPNRGDCLGMTGLARECAAANRLPFAAPDIKTVKPQLDDTFPVKINAADACPRYCGRVVRGINPKAETPIWMVERLRRGGIRAIHPVVDITNYVMLELGQPMHAFDLATLHGSIDVRMAVRGEKLTLLDGSEVTLTENTLLIADQQKALALAGVMGGEGSGVSETTRDIFFESAYFAPAAIMGRARQYGLHTDSSYRFERGVDPQLQARAIERATALLLEIAGGKPGPLVDINHVKNATRLVQLRSAGIKRLLGCDIPASDVQAILGGLGCSLKAIDGGWQVETPSYRFDLAIEADLIEELARIRGYGSIPRRLPMLLPEHPQQPETEIGVERIRSLLSDSGYQEIISYSFIDPALQEKVEPGVAALVLRNPISADLSVMRSSLISGLLSTLSYNINRQQKQASLFEIGSRYSADRGAKTEQRRVAGLRYGRRFAENWAQGAEAVDFFDIKADVERLFALGQQSPLFKAEAHPALHPGQSAAIHLNGEPVGWLGAIHPRLVRDLDLGAEAFVFEIELEAVTQARVPGFTPVSRFPAIRRDLAIVVDAATRWTTVEECILRAAPDCLKAVRLFDLYTGKGVESGRKSFAIGLILQEISRTLTDVEVESVTADILAVLNKNLGATLRE